ncbi:hypothetical protein [Mycobacterium lehmannii]|uniref:hypothetical protein n=1 Tax=Mycobacterium lehmannii TaxID=2048550 RepID=UPI000B93FAF9|nr:hypothetical protein [Mycobacterium lehmannii]
MDTIVFGTGMPCFLAFLDHHIDEIVATWMEFVETGQVVRARHENPSRDTVVIFRPASIGTVEFVPNEPAGRKLMDRMLWTPPNLIAHPDAADLPPDKAHYWTLNPVGFSARFETLPDGSPGLILGHWEAGRL